MVCSHYLNGYVVPLADVVDVGGDAGISADTVLLHQSDQLCLGEVIRRGGLAWCVERRVWGRWSGGKGVA